MPNVWQIAAGEPRRNYAQLFLNHDLMFMGPGRYGPYEKAVYYARVLSGEETANKVGQVRRFAEDVKAGDIILLRSGYRVVAIGLAVEDGYAWSETFDDVYGWDLQHTRRVIWQGHLEGELQRLQPTPSQELFAQRKQIPTFTALNDRAVLDRVEALFAQLRSRPLRPLPPPPPPPLSMDALGHELFSRGVPNESVDTVLVAIQRQRRLSQWYLAHGERSGRPTEHEVVAHMILPLLLSLGWSEQLLAVEWHKIDLAAFWGAPTVKERCVLVCEAKGIGHGLQDVFSQASDYVARLGLTECQKILLTDGARLYLYERQDEIWGEVPAGYLNVNLIRADHLAPADTNAVDTIVALTPAGVMRRLTESPMRRDRPSPA